MIVGDLLGKKIGHESFFNPFSYLKLRSLCATPNYTQLLKKKNYFHKRGKIPPSEMIFRKIYTPERLSVERRGSRNSTS